MRRSLLVVTALVVASGVGLSAAPAWGSHARVGATSAKSSDVLVFLRGPVTAHVASEGRVAERARQDRVTHLITAVGARVLARSDVPDVLFVRATTAQSHELAAAAGVEAVLPNTLVPGPSLPTKPPSLPAATTRRGAADPGPCGTAANPEADPEALTPIHGTTADLDGYDGAGVTVAILGDALSPTNPDLLRNAAYASSGSAAGTRVVTDYADFSGDGPNQGNFGAEAFGDASSIAAQGNKVYNLSTYARESGGRFALPRGCDIRITGDAPGSSLIALKLFGYDNIAYAEQTVQAINYAVANGASVISESFGFNNFPDTSQDAIRLADSAAVAAGVTVVVSSGDAGPNSTIGSPASDPDVLAVGATTTYRAYQQLIYGGINALRPSGGYVDDNISSFSSGGVAFDGKTVNLVAPGDLNWALCTANAGFFGCGNQPIELFGGTSESAPLTAGAAADVIGAYEATHGGTKPTPTVVMRILTSTTKDVDAPADQQGAGLLQVGAAVQLATSLPGTTASAPSGGILANTTQLNLTGAPESSQSAVLSFTNATSSPVQLNVATRALVPAARRYGVTDLSHSRHHDGLPTFTFGSGQLMVMRRVPIYVPPGTARVQFQAAFSQDFFVQTSVSLFDPQGRLAAYSFPQGDAGFADVEAATSGPGTWTAVVFEPFIDGESHGTVPWSITWWRFEQRAACTPSSLMINPGQQAQCDLAVTMPATGGDTSLAVVASTSASALTIPVTLRTQIPVSPDSATTFKGVISGGNGRGDAAGQTSTYSFQVTPGEHDLDVGVVLAGTSRGSSADVVEAMLVDPDGSTASRSANVVRRTTNETISSSLQLYAADPIPGIWRLLLVVEQPVDGIHVLLGFTGTIAFNRVSISSTLPDSATATLPAGGATFAVDVKNRGDAPMFVALDPRTTHEATISANHVLWNLEYFMTVPPLTSSIAVHQTSTSPTSFELIAAGGNPVLTPEGTTPYVSTSTSPDAPSLRLSPPTPLATGLWGVAADRIGPYTKPSPPTKSRDVISLTTLAFDPTVRANVYDVAKIKTLALSRKDFFGRYTPVGTQVRVAVAIRPTAPKGTVVRGTMLVEDVDEGTGSINLLAELPYEYVAP